MQLQEGSKESGTENPKLYMIHLSVVCLRYPRRETTGGPVLFGNEPQMQGTQSFPRRKKHGKSNDWKLCY